MPSAVRVRRGVRLLLVGLLGLFGALLVVPGVLAQSHAVLREFLPTGKYIIYLDGELDRDAEILYSQRAAAILVLNSRFGQPFLIQPRTRSVDRVPVEDLLPQENGSLDFSADARLGRMGSFQLQGSDVVISFDDLKARLKPNPPLLGSHDRAEVLKHSPEYARDAYKVDEAWIERLRQTGRKAEVRIFFGSWCPVCQRYLGRILKIDEALEESGITFVYYGLPLPPAAWEEQEFVRNKIERLPGAIVTSEGRELGRLSGYDWDRPEPRLGEILR